MGWLFPGFLAGAAAAALPLALHLLRRWPRRPVVFPSLRFLEAGHRRTESRWQRLRRWLVLAMRCAIFALLAAAFARPFRNNLYVRPSRAVVVVIDNSFSLRAKGRWPALQTWARKHLGSFAPGDELGLLLMAPEPTWLAIPSRDTGRVLQTLAGVSPGWLASRVEPALRLAGETVAAIPADQREVVVMTDEQRAAWSGTDFSRPLPRGVSLLFPPIPPPLGRQAALLPAVITAVPGGLLASVPIRNFTGPDKRTVKVYENGGFFPAGQETLDLKANSQGTFRIHLPADPEKPAHFRFALDSDDLPADDAAYAVWEPASEGAVILDPPAPGREIDFAAEALAAAAEVKPTLHVRPIPASAWSPRSVAILRNDASFGGDAAERLDAFLGAGGAALLFAGAGPRQRFWLMQHGIRIASLPRRAEPWTVHDWAMEQPLVAELARRRIGMLLGWEFRRGWKLPVDSLRPLAYWSGDAAALGQAHIGTGTVLICGFPPDRTAGDWPISPAFVPFLHQAASYLFGVERVATQNAHTGERLALGSAPGKWRAIEGPEAGRPAADVAGSVALTAPGIYEFKRGEERRLYAVNLPAEESDPATWSSGAPWLGLEAKEPSTETKMARVHLAAAEAEQKASLWWWAVAVCAVLMLAEMGLANRTAR